MQIPSIPTAGSVAGASLAAAKGGEADARSTAATNRQSTAEKPGGKSSENAAVDAGEQAGDRHGNGRQQLDVFQSDRDDENPAEPTPTSRDDGPSSDPDDPPAHLDLTI